MLHWRTIAWLSIGVVIIPLSLMHMFSPESPTWLISKGRSTDALKALKVTSQYREQTILAPYRSTYFSESLFMAYKVRQLSTTDEYLVIRQVRDLERANERRSFNEGNIFSKFSQAIVKPAVFKPFCILSMCFLFQQLSGIYILIFYTLNFFEDVKSNMNSNAAAVLVGLIRMFVGFITSQLLYKLGRRLLILTSFTLMAICITISGYFTYLINRGEYDESWIRGIPIGCLLFYICFSTIGALSVPWTMTAEVYPIEIRGVMQGLTVAVAHLIMFAVLKSYETLRHFFGGSFGLQFFFGCVCIVGVLFCALFLPETHRKKLEEITDYFNNNTVYLKRRRSSSNRSSSDNKRPEKNTDGSLLQKV